MEVVVCTTAVTRSDLHSRTFPQYVEFLKDVDVKWLINIDVLPDTEEIDVTVNYIQQITKGLDVEISWGQGGTRKSFYEACQKLSRLAHSYEPSYGFLWLEDDWLRIEPITLRQVIQQVGDIGQNDYIQFVRREGQVSFNPGLWGKNLFNELVVNSLKKEYSTDNANPERRCTYPIDYAASKVDVIHIHPLFYDIGRVWTKENNIWRTFQFKQNG